jgi:cysteine desulfurase/selenocysteine lyase
VADDGSLKLDRLDSMLSGRTVLVAVTHVSNVLGTVNPVKNIVEQAHSKNVPVLIDGAQAIQHQPVDVRDMGCDFYAFSGHKVYADMGIGVLYGKKEMLEQMEPWQYGGGMINSVSLEHTSFTDSPLKFEAGTQNIPGALSLGASIEYLGNIGMENIQRHEHDILKYAEKTLGSIGGVSFYGTASPKHSVLSFTLDGISSYDASLILDKMGIAVRSGHHCAQPLMKRFGISGTMRASFSLYNRHEEVDMLANGIKKARQMLL